MSEPTPAARITRADVEHVARLARLALTDAEAEEFTEQLAVIIGHADDVAGLDLDGLVGHAEQGEEQAGPVRVARERMVVELHDRDP